MADFLNIYHHPQKFTTILFLARIGGNHYVYFDHEVKIISCKDGNLVLILGGKTCTFPFKDVKYYRDYVEKEPGYIMDVALRLSWCV